MKNIVVVDIDGTIAKVGDRLKYLQQEKKDWDSFYEHCDEDEPIEDIIEIVKIFLSVPLTKMIFCTGRRSGVREKTVAWLGKLGFVQGFDYELLMRPDGDHRHDTEVKPQLLLDRGIFPENVICIFEDRDSMVAKWRELGYRCLQVDRGDF